MHGRPRSRSQTSQVSFLSSQPPPHTPARRTLASLNTPSPRASNVNLLKIKGSLTDPAPTRRRCTLGQVCHLSLASVLPFYTQLRWQTNLFDIDENSYVPYPASFTHAEPLALPLSLNDPFDHPDISFEYPLGTNTPGFHNLEPSIQELCCSVCGNPGPSLAELEPCAHLLCSACLTSALNIVGEKDMECAVCKTGVANFHLRNSASSMGSSVQTAGVPRGCLTSGALDSFNKENLVNEFHFFDLQGSSTPNRSERHHFLREGELPVLRIDNVPWVCIWFCSKFFGP
jgi:hypothetical protein